ncbi:MAG: glycosyltransferase [Pelotomaculum sp.]|nr:glycosyltransferase [Pelotomaculum sp.]
MEDTITLAMIVKNEAGNLKRCLDSVSGQVDEIVIVDTGSTDETLEIARRYTDKIYHFPWGGDFSAARNFAIEKAGGEWIISLDADEELVSGTGDLKRLVARDKHLEAYLLPLNNPTAGSPGEYNRFLVLRLFRNNGRYRFRGKIHEQVTVSEKGVVGIAEGPVISHKMLPARERNRKRGRNLALLKKAFSDDPQNYFLQYYIGVEWLMLGKPERALPHFQQAYRNLTDENLLFRGPALRYLIICLKELGRLDEAICLCLEADLKYPEYTDVYYLCGVLFEEKKEFQLAIKWLNQAVKCGTPPAIYSHMNGAGSFLAFYHLGYCHEMLGQAEVAENYYQQALDTNPGYIYPIYNLFLIMLAKRGPRLTLEYFKKKGYLGHIDLALAAAGLFFNWGYPELARRCLGHYETSGKRAKEFYFYLGKYNIYSGKLKQGLDYLKQVSEESSFFIQSQILRAVALLLQGRFEKVRSLALELWKNHAARCRALVLLSLARLVEKGGTLSFPQKVRDIDLLETALEILDQCSRYLPDEDRARKDPRLNRLINGLEALIKNNSPRGHLALIEHYRDKSYSARSFFDYKYGFGGNRV